MLLFQLALAAQMALSATPTTMSVTMPAMPAIPAVPAVPAPPAPAVGPVASVGPAMLARPLASAFAIWQQPSDPADSLLRVAANRLSRGDYRDAAALYRAVVRRYPTSMRLSEAMYYEAFALYRAGEYADARDAIDAMRERFPQAAARGDANTLRTRICGELAKEGDTECAEEVARVSASASVRSPRAPRAPASPEPSGSSRGRDSSCPDDDDEDDSRIAALNALLQMDAERAMPILTSVLARRDRCSERLRRKAVFLVAQKQSRESADVLLKAARTDPDSEVRQQAVFWLSQVRDPSAVDMLVEIVNGDGERALREKALFALSQHSNANAGAALRAFAENERQPNDLRERAIFSLGQRSGASQAEYLRSLYRKLDDAGLREKVLFALTQRNGEENEAFIRSVANDSRETIEVRKKAIFNLSQMRVSGGELVSLYTSLRERELREQVIFALSQRRDTPSIDKLMEIAKSDSDPDLRKKAIFWLGQSRDPRVSAFLLELINK
jgi:HEAT repeat protein